jgi:hypothetical protein
MLRHKPLGFVALLITTVSVLLAQGTAFAGGNAPVGGGGSCSGMTEPDSTQGQQQAYDDGLYTCTSGAWAPEAFIVGSVLQNGSSASCNSTNAGMLEWNGSAFQGCNGSTWLSLGAGGGTISLGTSTSATNPQRTSEAGTGLFSANSGQVSVAVSISGTGTDVADYASTGLNLPVATESYKINGVNAIWQDNTNFNTAVGDTALPSAISSGGGYHYGHWTKPLRGIRTHHR